MTNFTKKAILDTFQEMLLEKPFDKITVSALVSRCGISPNTFYYHYADIYDLLDRWLDRWFDSFLRDTSSLPNWCEKLKYLFHRFQSNPKIVYHISDSLSRERMERYAFTVLESQFYDYVQQQTAGLNVTEDQKKMLARFFCYSLLGFSLRFLWGKMEADVDSSIDALDQLFQATLASYLK